MGRTKGAERNILCRYKDLLRIVHYSSVVKYMYSTSVMTLMTSFMTEDRMTDRRTPPKQYPLCFRYGICNENLRNPNHSFKYSFYGHIKPIQVKRKKEKQRVITPSL